MAQEAETCRCVGETWAPVFVLGEGGSRKREVRPTIHTAFSSGNYSVLRC